MIACCRSNGQELELPCKISISLLLSDFSRRLLLKDLKKCNATPLILIQTQLHANSCVTFLTTVYVFNF